MIRFAFPLALAALPVLAGLFYLLRPRVGRAPLLRYAAALLVVLAVADPRVSTSDARNSVVFLIDRSASVARTAAPREIPERVRDIVAAHPDWKYGIVGFSDRADVESALGDALRLVDGPTNRVGSSLEPAVRLALSLLPVGGASQLVVVSDGRFSVDPISAIAAAQLSGVPIHAVPTGAERPQDVRLAAFTAPREASVGRPIALEVRLETPTPGPATFALYRNDELILVEPLDLAAGVSARTFTDAVPETGFYEYRAVVKRDEDPVPENDVRALIVRTVDRPSILLVDGRGDSAIPDLLSSIGLDYVEVDAVPSLPMLSDFRQLIYTGQSLSDLTEQQSSDVRQFVQNLGGGLLVVQGESEVRGFQTGPIESLLPVSFSVPERGRTPSLAIVYLLDRSSSMKELAGARAKIRVLREATAASVLLLPSETLVGIIGFYDDYDWIFPLQRLGDGTEAYRAIASLDAYGGTDVYYPLDDAIDQLIGCDAKAKHILLISDGQTTEVGRDYPRLLEKLDEHPDITLSAIAINRNPNVPFLTKLVQHGRGDLYFAADFVTLPQVTLEVTQRLSRSRFVDGPVDVSSSAGEVGTPGPIPPLGGYVLTYPRSASSTLLWAGDDPVFSTWRTGLGAVSVLNADLAGAWSDAWLSWQGMPALFERLLSTTEPIATTATGIQSVVEVTSATTSILLDARTPGGAFDEFLAFAAHLVPSATALDIRQVAPGLYKAQFENPPQGGYAVLARETESGRSFSIPLSIPYPSEFEAFGPDLDSLSELARFTGGRLLEREDRLDPVRSARSRRETPLFPTFLGIALALFLLDLGLRGRKERRNPAPDKGGRRPSD